MTTLAKEWDKQAALFAKADLHKTPGVGIEACRHNANLLQTSVTSMFLEAGYMPMALLLGTVVGPVIDSGRECHQCLSRRVCRAFEWYFTEDGNVLCVNVADDISEHDADGEAGGRGCTGPDGDCQLFLAQELNSLTGNQRQTSVSAGYLRGHATALDPLTAIDADDLEAFTYEAFDTI